MPKGTTSKGMVVNRNFGKWLSHGRGISGTFVAPHSSFISEDLCFLGCDALSLG